MSREIDEKVVSMEFDNRRFERGVATSMNTLEKLKQSLNLSGAVKGMENISKTAKGVDLSPISKGAEVIVDKFNYASVMVKRFFENIVDSAYMTGKRIASAFTIDPIKTGLAEYETQINAVQTILANTESKGSTLENVNAALDELNTYADKTIYNFTEMTRNIGTFTAAGVDLDKSVTSIKGIANLAAVSGSTSQQASTAMYQLSQALAAGKVQLMDWNSVVNAGMGGQVFQDALKRTATHMGYNVDAMIKKYGSFRESLTKGEWLTAEVLTETLTQLSGAYTEADLIAQGYSEEQAKQIYKLSQTAENAATKVKTFTQLMDTLKESAQSGWTQTWEILIGDFEEAKELWTTVSDTFGAFINQSSEARNTMLQVWKDLGGRQALIDGIVNAFKGFINVVKPIKDSFRDIFPPMRAKELLNYTNKFKDLMERFKNFTSAQGPNIKKTFTGIFSVIDLGLTFIKQLAGGIVKLLSNFTGLSGGVLGITGALGEWATSLRDRVKETNLIRLAIQKVVNFLQNGIDKFKEFAGILKTKVGAPGLEGFLQLMGGLWTIIQKIGSKISEIGSTIGSALVSVFRNGDIKSALDIVNGGLLASLIIGIKNFVGGITDAFDDATGLLGNVKELLDGVKGSLEAWQQNLKANTLLKLAGAIGILAASLVVIAAIDPAKLTWSLGAITALFADLVASMTLLTKFSIGGGPVKSIGIMIALSASVLILSTALKKVADIDNDKLLSSIIGIASLTSIMVLAATAMSMNEGKVMKGATSLVIFAAAIKILASACKDMSALNWDEMVRGLTGVGVLMAEVAGFMFLAKFGKSTIQSSTSMVIMAGALAALAGVVKIFGEMDSGKILQGTVAIGVLLTEFSLFSKLAKNATGASASMLLMAGALGVLIPIVNFFGEMDSGKLLQGVLAISTLLVEMSLFSKMASGGLGGSAAILVMAGALAILVPVLKSIASMSIGEIIKSIVTLAATLAVLGGAGVLLAPVVPSILALSGAIALFGVGCLAAGVGVAAFAAALATLATVGTVGATAIVAALSIIITGIVALIPTIASEIGKAIVILVGVLVKCVPVLVEGFLTLLTETLKSLVKHVPELVTLLYQFIVKTLDAFAEVLPGLIQSAANVIGAFFTGVVDALSGMSFETVVKGLLGVGLLSALIVALGAITPLIPSAMVGVLGMGAVITELALVLAAIGAIAQIPGLQWLINEGGQFLEAVGKAIGSFVGGIVGGFMSGVSSEFPQIGKDLAKFMENVQPFIDGAKKIDNNVANGVKALATTILTLTAAEILDGLTSWFTGGSSLADFGKEIAEFGPHLAKFAKSVKGVDGGAIKGAAQAAKALAEMADTVPNKGGVAAWFAGENSLAAFGKEIVSFGKNLNSYSKAVKGVNTAAIQASVTAGKALSELADTVPNQGGMVAWFTGDNSIASFGDELVSFGKDLKKYSEAVKGINIVAIAGSAVASKSIVELSKNIPEDKLFTNETTLSEFGKQLSKFGKQLANYSESVTKINVTQLSSVITQVNRLVSMAKGMTGIDTSGMSSFGSSLGTLGQNGIKSFIKAFTDAHPRITTAATNMVNTFVRGVNSSAPNFTKTFTTLLHTTLNNINRLKDNFHMAGKTLMLRFQSGITSGSLAIYSTITSMISKVLSTITSKYITFNNAGRTLIEKFVSGMESKSTAATLSAANIANKAVKAIDDYYGNFYNSGVNSAKGFAAGISDNIWRAEAKASAMAKAAKTAAEKTLDEYSPSKEFYKVGAFGAIGFINTFVDYTSKARDAGANIANSAKTGLTNAISKIVDVIEGNVELQPTIRPVLDLSNVTPGVRKLNAMFGYSQAMSINASVNRASSEEIQNGVVTPVGNTFQFTQNNYSPKALSRLDIYRQTRNQFSAMERVVRA